ncbi:MAG: glycoside hydrolase [Chitinophagaceae bacterium]|nr:glycoside hydrolase [Chitinophagaceae bacterium]
MIRSIKYKFSVVLIASQLLLTAVQSQNAAVNNVDHGLVPPVLNHNPLPHYDYDKLDYGMNMGLEQTLSGRIWSCWTAGGDDPNSFLILMHSDDDGITWSKPALVVDAQDPDMKKKKERYKMVHSGEIRWDVCGCSLINL